ncbi:MAG: hypothetical protein II828_05825 [Clostridia bacterium]|nr:hypothetical protein [Clostridia bacterium]
MKKILILISACIIIAICLSGCTKIARDQALEEIPQSYVADDYYDEQKTQIEEIVSEYTEKINQASRASEVKTLKEECLKKIESVYKKEEALADAKEKAALCRESMKGKLLPYQEVSALLEKYDAIDQEHMDDPSDLNTVVKQLNEIVQADELQYNTYHYQSGDLTFDVNVSYAVDADGIPMMTIKASQPWESVLTSDDLRLMMQFATVVNSDIIINDGGEWADRMIACNAFFVHKSWGMTYLYDEDYYPRKDAARARFEVADEYTLVNHLTTAEQLAQLRSDSVTYMNSDGIETNRDGGYLHPNDYIVVVTYDNNNDDDDIPMYKKAAWLILL